jgi:uncharacterized protein YqjF (DUF2071 family)
MKPFLTAEWRNLVMINYEVPPGIFRSYLPAGVEIDLFEGKCFVSLVAFHFLNTKVKGIAFPFHINFEEVNLRFYVKYKEGTEYKRGVVFISEIVPKRLIALVARIFYGEKYQYAPMKSSIEEGNERKLFFTWGSTFKNRVFVTTAPAAKPMQTGSKEEFIFEHYRGYTSLRSNKTGEYKVEHPSWNVYPVLDFEINADFGQLYGPSFSLLANTIPDSVFVAEGSPVKVYGRKMLNP